MRELGAPGNEQITQNFVDTVTQAMAFYRFRISARSKAHEFHARIHGVDGRHYRHGVRDPRRALPLVSAYPSIARGKAAPKIPPVQLEIANTTGSGQLPPSRHPLEFSGQIIRIIRTRCAMREKPANTREADICNRPLVGPGSRRNHTPHCVHRFKADAKVRTLDSSGFDCNIRSPLTDFWHSHTPAKTLC
jgi:hypothetical protein